ncbi:hypothetical protein LPJ61_004026, partial [Coemansia biformis]
MRLVVSVLALAAACAGVVAAGPLLSGRLVTHLPHVRVRHNSFIVEFHDEAADAHVKSVRRMVDVSVDHHYNSLFKGMAVTIGDTINPAHLASIHGVKAVYPNR